MKQIHDPKQLIETNIDGFITIRYPRLSLRFYNERTVADFNWIIYIDQISNFYYHIMATAHRAPKQWCLGKDENVTSSENWKQNILYTLSLDPNFAPFLVEGVSWRKKSKSDPLHAFSDDENLCWAKLQTTARSCHEIPSYAMLCYC